VSVEGGASSRTGGLFAAASLVVLVVVFASAVGHIPEAVIGGLLFVIGLEIISGRLPDGRLAVRAGRQPAVLFVVSLALALTVPLQWAILGGALLSLLNFVASAGNRVRLHECHQHVAGWVVSFDARPRPCPPAAWSCWPTKDPTSSPRYRR
jgi:sulfate permease, SulP family